MPKNRRNTVRRGGRGRPQGRRRTPFPQTPANLRGLTGRFVYQRMYQNSAITLTGGTNSYGALPLQASTMPSGMVAMLQSFDVCTVNWVDVTFVPQWKVNTFAVTDEGIPQLAVVRNYDDFSAPSSFDSVLAQRGVRMIQFGRTFKIRAFPRGLVQAPTTGSPGFYFISALQQWMNTTYWANGGSMPMIKFAIGSPTLAPTNYPAGGILNIFYTVNITCGQNVG